MNNLSPRAKIGDVVIVKCKLTNSDIIQATIVDATVTLLSDNVRGWLYWYTDRDEEVDVMLEDKDILKNLTTNVSYE